MTKEGAGLRERAVRHFPSLFLSQCLVSLASSVAPGTTRFSLRQDEQSCYLHPKLTTSPCCSQNLPHIKGSFVNYISAVFIIFPLSLCPPALPSSLPFLRSQSAGTLLFDAGLLWVSDVTHKESVVH